MFLFCRSRRGGCLLSVVSFRRSRAAPSAGVTATTAVPSVVVAAAASPDGVGSVVAEAGVAASGVTEGGAVFEASLEAAAAALGMAMALYKVLSSV